MLSLIETRNYKALKYVRQTVRPMQVLVGPNATGKTTFLDVPGLISSIVRDGLEAGIEPRASSLLDLFHFRRGEHLELAVEMIVPDALVLNPRQTTARYELRLTVKDGEQSISHENLWLKPQAPPTRREGLFPQEPVGQEATIHEQSPKGWAKVVSKSPKGNDYFKSEKTGWNSMFRFGSSKTALANVPDDESRFPIATWIRSFLATGIQRLALDSEEMRRTTPSVGSKSFLPNGSNLPRVIRDFRNHELFSAWMRHVQTVLPEIQDISIEERPEDRSLYLSLQYRGGKIPSWLVSDGTLRLLALTLLAYLPTENRAYLIEEPENGIHPKAIEAIFESLSSPYSSQVFIATHSPIILSMASPEQLLCFAKTGDGCTDIINGQDHPSLRRWQGEVGLEVLFASGVLG
jgi:predicted ATPase